MQFCQCIQDAIAHASPPSPLGMHLSSSAGHRLLQQTMSRPHCISHRSPPPQHLFHCHLTSLIPLPPPFGPIPEVLCNAPTGVKGQTLAKRVRLLGKSTRSYGKLSDEGSFSPKVDVQAWPLSNTTVQEELL